MKELICPKFFWKNFGPRRAPLTWISATIPAFWTFWKPDFCCSNRGFVNNSRALRVHPQIFLQGKYNRSGVTPKILGARLFQNFRWILPFVISPIKSDFQWPYLEGGRTHQTRARILMRNFILSSSQHKKLGAYDELGIHVWGHSANIGCILEVLGTQSYLLDILRLSQICA